MEITNTADIFSNEVGVWKTGEHTAFMRGYGYSKISQYFESKEDAREQFTSGNFKDYIIDHFRNAVAKDLGRKIKLMVDEDYYLPEEELFNYGRFFKRYGVEADLSIVSDIKRIAQIFPTPIDDSGKTEWDVLLHLSGVEWDDIRRFFGKGEFPFVDIYFILKEDGELYLCYTISR